MLESLCDLAFLASKCSIDQTGEPPFTDKALAAAKAADAVLLGAIGGLVGRRRCPP